MRSVIPKFVPVAIPLALCCLASQISDDALDAGIRSRLSRRVVDFDNRHRPLIPTLFEIAGRYGLPMGIEQVTADALWRPVPIRIRRGAVREVLDSCMRQFPDLAWDVRKGAVFVYGQQEVNNAANLFSVVVPRFEAHDATLDEAGAALDIKLVFLVEKPAGGIIGSRANVHARSVRRLRFLPMDIPLRSALNLLVGLNGEGIWIARVPPERLKRIPPGGLWRILHPCTREETPPDGLKWLIDVR